MKLTPKELIAMAREAGFPVSWTQGHSDGDEILTCFASLVSARTREECAKVCESLKEKIGHSSQMDGEFSGICDCVEAILAMGERT